MHHAWRHIAMVKQWFGPVEAWRVMATPGSLYEGQAGGWGMRSGVFITILDDAVMAHI
jgi:hypothetical protein